MSGDAVRQADALGKDSSTDFVARRQLTVLVADLVGSTARSSRLDPVEMPSVVGACRMSCAKVIEREDGFAAKCTKPSLSTEGVDNAR